MTIRGARSADPAPHLSPESPRLLLVRERGRGGDARRAGAGPAVRGACRGARPVLAALGLAVLLPLQLLQAPAFAQPGEAGSGPAATAAEAPAPFPPWRDRHDALETALTLGEIVERERLGVGVTNPWKVVVEHQGQRLKAVWKPLSEDPGAMHSESWRAEVAAYRLSRYLGLDVVPPTVARTLDREEGSLQLWVDGCRPYGDIPDEEPRPGYRWVQQLDRMRLFDTFLANSDRNAGNFLIDADWNVVLIDHSRALPLNRRPRRLPQLPVRVDAALLDRMDALDLEQLDLLIGDLYSRAELGAVLRHRDRVMRTLERQLDKGKAILLGERQQVQLAAAAADGP